MRETKAEWWLKSVDCETCLVTIRKHHIARHNESKMHKRLSGQKYQMMESDLQFTRFLLSRTARSFEGLEAEIYARALAG